jgi:D-alanine-D-alanine ligase
MADPAGGFDKLLPALQAADVAFPVLHGIGGEDGQLQSLLEEHNIKFVGSGAQASSLCFNKATYTELLKQHDILAPRTELVTFDQYQASGLTKQPFVLKPNDGGSSIDTFIIRSIDSRDETAIKAAFGRHPQMLLQQLISGTEITVAVLKQTALPVIEIVPPADQEFDYENKYSGATQELCPPKSVSQSYQTAAQRLAETIHKLCGCRDMSRTDIIIDQTGQLYVLETNTIPGLTNQSLMPKAAATIDIDMPKLCDRLVQATLAR